MTKPQHNFMVYIVVQNFMVNEFDMQSDYSLILEQ